MKYIHPSKKINGVHWLLQLSIKPKITSTKEE